MTAIERIQSMLNGLGLKAVEARLEGLLEQASKKEPSYADFLDELLSCEVDARRIRYLRARLQLAHLPFVKNFEHFDFGFQPSIDERQIQELRSLRFIHEASNVVFLGPPGVGKTHLSVALAEAAIQAGFGAYFMTAHDLVTDLGRAYREGRLDRRMRVYLAPKVLIIDEMGYLPLDDIGATIFFQLVSARYERGSIILTSNKSYGDWGSIFGDPITAISSLKDAETGQRGFLLTGQDRYLEPYRQALTGVPSALDGLEKVTAVRRPDQAERLKQLRPLVKDKLDELGATIQARQSQGLAAALAIVQTDRGKTIMDEIRARCAEMQSAANQRVTQFSAEAHASANRLGIVSSVGSGTLLVLLFLATATIQRGTRRREQLIESLNQSEMKLRVSHDLLHTTLNSIGDAVISTDAQGRITFGNPVTQSVLRLTAADLVGKNLDGVFKLVNEYTRRR